MCHHFSSKIPFGQMERGICAKLTLPQKSSSKARREKRKITQKYLPRGHSSQKLKLEQNAR